MCAWWPTREAVAVGVYLAIAVRGGSGDNRYLAVGWHLWSFQKATCHNVLQEATVKQKGNVPQQPLWCLISLANKIMMAFHIKTCAELQYRFACIRCSFSQKHHRWYLWCLSVKFRQTKALCIFDVWHYSLADWLTDLWNIKSHSPNKLSWLS